MGDKALHLMMHVATCQWGGVPSSGADVQSAIHISANRLRAVLSLLELFNVVNNDFFATQTTILWANTVDKFTIDIIDQY